MPPGNAARLRMLVLVMRRPPPTGATGFFGPCGAQASQYRETAVPQPLPMGYSGPTPPGMPPGLPRMSTGSNTQLQGLISLAREGDERSKTLLVDHACDRLLKLTRKMFRGFPGLRRWEQTDDVFQNSVIRLHRALACVEIQSVRHFFNLAAEMVRRELLDLKKHYYGVHGQARNHHTDFQPSDERGGVLAQSASRPDDFDRWANFHEAVLRLPAEHKEVANLLFYEALPQDEAAVALGISIRTLKRRWQETKLLLSEHLRDASG